MKNNYYPKNLIAFLFIISLFACDDLNTVNNNNPSRDDLLTSGPDLETVLQGGYLSFWQAVHDVHPVMALMVAADAYAISWGNFGMQRMGDEPRKGIQQSLFRRSRLQAGGGRSLVRLSFCCFYR